MTERAGVTTVGPPDAVGSVWFVHGVLGQGRNWRSFARKLIGDRDLKAVLPDLRNHGEAPPAAAPHTIEAAAADLAALAAEIGPPTRLVGHSLGGKVVASWLGRGDLPASTQVWVLDAPPGPTDPALPRTEVASDPGRVMSLLEAAPVPADTREPVREHLLAGGLPQPIVAWLLTSVARTERGWDWVYDLGGVRGMLESYHALDLWPVIEAAGPQVRLVRAGAGGRWTAAEIDRAERAAATHGVGFHTLPNAGHWLHVDATDEVLALLGSG